MNSISSKAEIGTNVKFGNYVTVYDDVVIGDNVVIDSYSEIGLKNGNQKGKLIIGQDSRIRSHSIIYAGSSIGNGFLIAHNSIIRENCEIGEKFQIGANCLIQPNCKIGNYVRIIANSMITHNSTIHNYVWIFPGATFTSDPKPPSSDNLKGPTVEDYAIISSGAILFPGINVGKDAIVAAGCVLTKDLKEGMIAKGIPGKVTGKVSDIKMPDKKNAAYPWRKHFHRGYPDHIIKEWVDEMTI